MWIVWRIVKPFSKLNTSQIFSIESVFRKRRAKDLLEKARDDGGLVGSALAGESAEERLQSTKAALAKVSTFTPEVIESRLKVWDSTASLFDIPKLVSMLMT